MNRVRIVKIAAGVLLLLAAVSGAFFLGSKYALEHLSTRRVNPYELGLAMKKDHFFRTYRENTLLITGMVLKVEQKNGSAQIFFDGTHTIDVRCSLKIPLNPPEIGSYVTLATEAAEAVRLTNGVLLRKCTLL